MSKLPSNDKDVRSIYDDDHSPDLLELFLDPTMIYSCAYFERDDMTLEEAQLAKLDLSLGKCDLQPGQVLLEIGCGYGACAFRAAEKFGVDVIAVTPSKRQARYAAEKMRDLPDGAGRVQVLQQGWEECCQPVDRIVSIGALEHIGFKNYAAFFARCRELLPEKGGRMMLHCIVQYSARNLERKKIELTHENVLFAKFIAKEIFPGGQLSDPDTIIESAEAAGFNVRRTQRIGLHYAQTLDIWTENLVNNREAAIALKQQQVYDRYIKYLTGCADHFRSGHIDLCQFTMTVT